MSNIFDFGFTAVDETELKAVQEAQVAISEQTSTAAELEAKVNNLYNAVVPLLTNLKKNPEKDYILWPNRLAKVEEFETMLQNIYMGK
jgi:hypothetical protein